MKIKSGGTRGEIDDFLRIKILVQTTIVQTDIREVNSPIFFASEGQFSLPAPAAMISRTFLQLKTLGMDVAAALPGLKILKLASGDRCGGL
jgi:hypothetical protein